MTVNSSSSASYSLRYAPSVIQVLCRFLIFVMRSPDFFRSLPQLARETAMGRKIHSSFRDAPLWRGPGIHNPRSWLWIPGSLALLTPRNDEVWVRALPYI